MFSAILRLLFRVPVASRASAPTWALAFADLCDTAAVIAPVLQTAVYVLSPDHTQVTLRGTVLWTGFGAKRLDYLCFVFCADAFSGTPHDGNDEGTLEWVPIDDLTSRPMWDSDHRWLPMLFDKVTKPFYGVMPYDGHDMVIWSFQR